MPRCAIFDLHGTEIASAYREIPVRYPRPLWAEVDPETWWSSTVKVVREALDRSSIAPNQIAGVGLSGLMHAPVLLDAGGQPLVPAMLWMRSALRSPVRGNGPRAAGAWRNQAD